MKLLCKKSNLARVQKFSSLRMTLTEEEKRLVPELFGSLKLPKKKGTPKPPVPLKKYSSKKFFWNGLMVGKQKSEYSSLAFSQLASLSCVQFFLIIYSLKSFLGS